MTQADIAASGIDADIRAFVEAAHAQQVVFLRELVKVPSDNPSGDCARMPRAPGRCSRRSASRSRRIPCPRLKCLLPAWSAPPT